MTLIPVGPLTNIGLLLRTYPAIAEKIAAISLMGGAMGAGNWTPAAEFNIWVDPEAARIVFRSGLPITMHGLDVTHKALMGLPEADRLDAVGTRVGHVFADLLRFFTKFHVEKYGTADTPIHDAVAVAHVALPGLVTTRRYHVDVETTGELTRGRTVVDDRGQPGADAQRGRRAGHRPGRVRGAGDRGGRQLPLRSGAAPTGSRVASAPRQPGPDRAPGAPTARGGLAPLERLAHQRARHEAIRSADVQPVAPDRRFTHRVSRRALTSFHRAPVGAPGARAGTCAVRPSWHLRRAPELAPPPCARAGRSGVEQGTGY